MKSGYDPRLSGLRGLAAIGVVLYHVSLFAPFAFGWLFIDGTRFSFFSYAIYSCLWLGVPVFFALSMFLLLNSLDRNPNLRHYFMRRIRRIWPIYFGCVIAAYLLYGFPVVQLAQYLTFTQYWVLPSGFGPLGVFWTLQIEEAMYLMIPFIWMARRKTTIAWCFIGISVAWTAATLFAGNLFSGTIFAYLTNVNEQDFYFPLFLAAYGFGILAYLGKVHKDLRWVLPVVVAIVFLYSEAMTSPMAEWGYQLRQLTYFLALPGIAGLLVNPPGFLKRLAILGEASYATYATQFFFIDSIGAAAIVVVPVFSFFVELGLRPREITKRLKLAYFGPTIKESGIIV